MTRFRLFAINTIFNAIRKVNAYLVSQPHAIAPFVSLPLAGGLDWWFGSSCVGSHLPATNAKGSVPQPSLQSTNSGCLTLSDTLAALALASALDFLAARASAAGGSSSGSLVNAWRDAVTGCACAFVKTKDRPPSVRGKSLLLEADSSGATKTQHLLQVPN